MDSLVTWKPSEIQSMEKLAMRVSKLQAEIPTREENLPLAYMDSTELARLNASDDPSLAMVPISFMEGFPTVDGVPLWERLPSEPMEYFDLLRAYIKLGATDGKRRIDVLATRANLNPKAVGVVAKLWHWPARVHAYDVYKEMERQAVRMHEMHEMEGKHGKAADKVFELCLSFIETHHAELTPKSALDWFKMATELKRLSLGLPRNEPVGAQANGGGTININQVITPGAVTPNQEQDRTRVGQILGVLKQVGAFHKEVANRGEVVEDATHIDATDIDATRIDATRIDATDIEYLLTGDSRGDSETEEIDDAAY